MFEDMETPQDKTLEMLENINARLGVLVGICAWIRGIMIGVVTYWVTVQYF